MRRIGIDVGGTNTDAALMDGSTVVATTKTPTTTDVTSGVTTALRQILDVVSEQTEGADPASNQSHGDTGISAVMVGTTHYTNAVIERRHLARTAALRVSLPASASLLPFCDWPADLAAEVNGGVYLVHGGHEYDGRPMVPLDEQAIAEAARAMKRDGVDAVAVSATFSPLTATCEERAAEIIKQEHPEAKITLSSALGRIGLLERENVALMNASLVGLAATITDAFTNAIATSGLDAELFITQNDGTIARAEVAKDHPVFSFSSGPTNSMRGAALLSGHHNAIVCDVGGTTADVGCVVNGFPREANNVVAIGGVRTLFRLPDVLSVAVGGGTMVQVDDPAAQLTVGPQSVGYRLTEQAMVFGGDTTTLTDIAVAAGLIDLGDSTLVAELDQAMVTNALKVAQDRIADAVDRSKTDATPVPLLAVGGGAALVPDSMDGITEVVNIKHQEVANAVGAAIAQVSGETDRIYRDLSRQDALEAATAAAVAKAVEAGAAPESVTIVESEDFPLSYLPGQALRVRVRAIGALSTAV